MKCNPWVGGSIGRRGFPMLGTGKRGLSTYVRELFINNEQGFFYDHNDLSTMFQDAAGTAPVTAVGQPVGLMLDKSKGLELGSDLRGTGASMVTEGVTAQGDHTYRIVSSGELQSFTYINIPILVVEVDYEILGTPTGSIRIASSTLPTLIPTTAGRRKAIIYNTRGSVGFVRSTAPTDVTIKVHSIRQILGNHAYQTTSSMRPLFVASPQRLDFDTVDDKLIANLPAQLTGCTVVRSVPNVGTQILTGQTIPATYNDNTDHCGLIVINRALTPRETSVITSEFNKRAGV